MVQGWGGSKWCSVVGMGWVSVVGMGWVPVVEGGSHGRDGVGLSLGMG